MKRLSNGKARHCRAFAFSKVFNPRMAWIYFAIQ